MRYRLAIDAYVFTVKIVGIGRYTQQILLNLLNNNYYDNFDIELYSAIKISDHELFNLGFPKNKFSRIKRINCEFINLSKIHKTTNVNKILFLKIFSHLWAYLFIGKILTKNPPHFFWSPKHYLPRNIPDQTVRIVTIHDLTVYKFPETMNFFNRQLEKYLLPKAINNADLIFCDCNSIKQEIVEHFTNCNFENRIYDVLLGSMQDENKDNGINIRDIQKQHGISNNYFLFVGTLEPRKNLDRLIKSYIQLDDKTKQKCQFLIVGDIGWGNKDFLKINFLPIHYIGYVSDKTLQILYQNAKFLAFPSLYEGFGFPIVEAIKNRCPVLSSNYGAMAEIAGNHLESAYLVDPLDINEISKGLETLINNDQLRRKIIKGGLLNSEKYNWDNYLSEFISLICDSYHKKNIDSQ